MNPRLKLLAYLGAAFFFFIFFLFATFPTDVLETRIVNQIEESLGNQYQLKIGKSTAGIFSGFVFKNVELNQKQGMQDIRLLKAEKLNIQISLMSFLRQRLSISFDAVLAKGEFEGSYSTNSSESELELSFDDFNLKELQFLSSIHHLNLSGLVNGDANFNFSRKSIENNEGELDLQFENLKLDSFKINVDPQNPEATLDFPAIQLSGSRNSKMIGELKRNNLEIKELLLKGGDVDLSLKGRITLADQVENSQVNLDGTLKINPTLTGKIALLALVEQQKEPDGSYRLKISGRLAKPSITIGNFRLPL